MLLFKNHAWVNSGGQAEGEAGRVWKAPGRGSSARVGAASQLLDLSWQMLQQKKRSDGVALIREEEEEGPERTHKRRPLAELEPVLEKPTARIIQIQHRQSRAMTPIILRFQKQMIRSQLNINESGWVLLSAPSTMFQGEKCLSFIP